MDVTCQYQRDHDPERQDPQQHDDFQGPGQGADVAECHRMAYGEVAVSTQGHDGEDASGDAYS